MEVSMSRFASVWLMLVLAMFFIISCSGSGDGPMSVIGEREAVVTNTSHTLWGLWQFTADPVNETLDITRVRTGTMHLNALPFLEPPALVYLSLESLEFNGDIIEADIGLRHPFLGLTEFTGFDVCGVLISNGSYDGFDDSDINYAGPDDTYLLNPDGHSRWWNPVEFPVNTGTMSGYNDGLLGAPDSFANYNSTLNGYKYFSDDLTDPDDPMSEVTQANRGVFSAGQKNIRHFSIQLGTEGLVFNYAIDANWEFPEGPLPWTAPDDFGPNANRAEPWWIDVTETSNSLYYYEGAPGGSISLDIDVHDWFNIGDISVYVEAANGVTPISGPHLATGGGEGYSTYSVDILDPDLTVAGTLDLLITVECEDEDFQGFITGTNTSAYCVHRADVSAEPVTTHTVTGIFPAHGTPDYLLEDVEVYGTEFADGVSLGVRLERTSEPDIGATNVVFQDANTITCDLSIPATAATGLWDVVVTNGDAGEATGADLFEIFDCGTMTACTTGSSIFTVPSDMSGVRCGVTCTREGTSYLIAAGESGDTLYAMDASSTSGSLDYKVDPGGNLDKDLACTSDNTIFFTYGGYSQPENQLYQISFDPDTGFGTYSLFASLDTDRRIQRICVDDEDNPIVLTFDYAVYPEYPDVFDVRVHHWNGTGWDETLLPATVIEGGDKYVQDFDYNPVLDHYVFVSINYPATPRELNLYAIDRDGNITHTEEDIFDWNYQARWWGGIYIDQDDPDCHIFAWGGNDYDAEDKPRPSARYDAFYGNKAGANMPTIGSNGPGGGRGAWAPGTTRFFTPSMSSNQNIISWFTLPSDW